MASPDQTELRVSPPVSTESNSGMGLGRHILLQALKTWFPTTYRKVDRLPYRHDEETLRVDLLINTIGVVAGGGIAILTGRPELLSLVAAPGIITRAKLATIDLAMRSIAKMEEEIERDLNRPYQLNFFDLLK